MKVVIQRVLEASVAISGKTVGTIQQGYLILVGFSATDQINDFNWMAQKIVGLRVFNDLNGLMNLSIQEVQGDILLISQFTLYASTKKGNRPSFMKAAKPNDAQLLYHQFHQILARELGKPISTGEFGADMKVQLINDGPVTIVIDSENKE